MPKNSYAAVSSRREELLRFLALNSNVTLGDISAKFGTSEMTIRRDLLVLSNEGLIGKSVNNQYYLNCDPAFDPKYFLRYSANRQKKVAIADAAAALIPSGSFLFLDSGTTVLELAKRLIALEDICVVTNNLYIPMYISQRPCSVSVEFLGGNVNLPSMSTSGISACRKLDEYHADFVFFSADGLDLTLGVTTKEYLLADVKKAMLRNASKRVLLIDSSKICARAVQSVASLDELDIVITDAGIRKEDEQRLKELVPKVIVAKY